MSSSSDASPGNSASGRNKAAVDASNDGGHRHPVVVMTDTVVSCVAQAPYRSSAPANSSAVGFSATNSSFCSTARRAPTRLARRAVSKNMTCLDLIAFLLFLLQKKKKHLASNPIDSINVHLAPGF
jgi:hypothetical protein